MAELVRVAALNGYFEVMARFGTDPRPLLREQGLGMDLLTDAEQMIPAVAAIRLLERSAQATGCKTLGLQMARNRSLANLGATSLIIAHQPTLRCALEALREFRMSVNSTLVLHLEEMDDIALLREDFHLSRPEPARQSTELALAVLAKLCIAVLGSGWSPQSVCFTHDAPPPDARTIYHDLFRCPLAFDSDFNGIIIRRADLDLVNIHADEQLALQARLLLTSTVGTPHEVWAEHVEHLIRIFLPTGKASIQICAATLGMAVRTLQRHLDAEGTSFSNLLNAARKQLASQYLANPRMRVTDVAGLLGYTSIGAFSRWYKANFGTPPRQQRSARSSSGT